MGFFNPDGKGLSEKSGPRIRLPRDEGSQLAAARGLAESESAAASVKDDDTAAEFDGALGTQSLAACLSLALLLTGTYLLNSFIFPSVAVAYPAGREISTCCGAAFAVAVAVVAFRCSHLMRERAWSMVCLAVFGCSLALLVAGITWDMPWLVALGSPFGGAGGVWFSVLAGLAFVRSGLRRSLVCVPSAFALACLVQAGLDIAGFKPGYAGATLLYFLCTAGSYLLIRKPAGELIGIIRESQSPAVLDATNPQSFLPLGSKAFIAIGLFNAACGYAFGSGMAVTSSSLMLASLAPALGLFFVMAVMRCRVSPDSIYLLATMLVIAGLMLIPLRHVGAAPLLAQVPAALLQGGSSCFSLLSYLLVASLGARNPVGSLSVSASVVAAGHFGIACGAIGAQGVELLAADGAGSTPLTLLALAAITFVFVLFNMVPMRRFSFEELIRDLRPVPLPIASASGLSRDGDRSAQQTLDGNATAGAGRGLAHQVADNGTTADIGGELAQRTADSDTSVGAGSRFANPGILAKSAGLDAPADHGALAGISTAQAAGQVPQASNAPESPTIDQRCNAVARRYQLTPREGEVLALLARGRTSPIIQEKLVVSQNTVRTHVRHIYAKLNVHSQQELINLVDSAG